MKRVLLALALFPALAWGQISTNLSGTIAVTNTFQSIATATINRQGCFIQNPSSDNQWVFFGPIANATKDTSVLLPAATANSVAGVSCATGAGKNVQDQISVTGTSGDKFMAQVQ